MDEIALMEGLNFPIKALNQVKSYKIGVDEYEWYWNILKNDSVAFERVWKLREDRYQWALAFYVRAAVHAYENYRDKGISDQIYWDSMKDLKIWLEQCYRKYGIYGIYELLWIGQTIKLEVFRLGRLQYEKMVIKKDLGQARTIKSGTDIINLHIPEGEKLDRQSCLESLSKVKSFYGMEDNPIIICDSWLLSPKLREVLDKESNIIKFQELFYLIDWRFEYPQAEERIFKDIMDNKEDYPEDTSLQRKAKAYYLRGEDFGVGLGVIKDRYLNKEETWT